MKKINYPHFKIQDSEIEGEIIGAFAADGGCCPQSDYQTTFYFGLDEEIYAKNFSKLLFQFFNKKPYFYKYPKGGKIMVRYKSKDICRFLRHYLEWTNPKTYSIRIKNLAHNKSFVKGFLRGYFDCDGYTEKRYLRIEFMSVSKSIIEQIGKMLIAFGYMPVLKSYQSKNGNRRRLYTIRLNKSDAYRFLISVKPRNQKRIAGLPGFEPGLEAIQEIKDKQKPTPSLE